METPRDRFLTALSGGVPARPSVASPTSVATIELMKATGAYFPRAHLDGRKMADLSAGGYEILGYDTIAPIFSIAQEAAAMGCQVDWGRRDWMPINVTSPYKEPDEVKLSARFLKEPPIKAPLDAIRLLRARYGSEVAVIGKVMGPWTLAYHLRGVQDFLLDTVLDPDKARRFLDVLLPVSLLFARAQIEAGADAIVVADHCTGDMVRASTYRDFLLPLHRRLNEELRFPTILHCCGRSLDRLDYFAQAGFTAYHFESKNDPRKALEIAAGRMALIGNVNNPNTLLNGTVDDVRREAEAVLRAGIHALAPECAVPCRTPNRNLMALVEVAGASFRQ